MVWQQHLRGNSLAWLLEADDANPGVRYFALPRSAGSTGR